MYLSLLPSPHFSPCDQTCKITFSSFYSLSSPPRTLCFLGYFVENKHAEPGIRLLVCGNWVEEETGALVVFYAGCHLIPLFSHWCITLPSTVSSHRVPSLSESPSVRFTCLFTGLGRMWVAGPYVSMKEVKTWGYTCFS